MIQSSNSGGELNQQSCREPVRCKGSIYVIQGWSKISNLKPFKNLRGEITIVISELNNKKKASNNLNESDKKKIKMLVKKLSTKEIVNLLNYEKSISKKEIYNYCLSLKKW